MPESWRCGDCGALWPMNVKYCRRPLDDYLALRGGSIESAMSRHLGRALGPLIARIERDWTPQPKIVARWTGFTEAA